MTKLTQDQKEALPGYRSTNTRPLIQELISKGQGKEVLELLYSAGLKYQEVSSKPGFRLLKRG